MRQDCINAVEQALGRALKSGEAQRIEQRIREQKIQLATKDRAKYLQMTEAQRLHEAAKAAAEQLKADAAVKQKRIALTVLANQHLADYFDSQPGSILDNAPRVMAEQYDGYGNNRSAESSFHAIYKQYTAELSGEIEKFGPKLLGLLQNDKALEPVFRELRGEDTGITLAKAFAAKLNATFESMRIRFNNGGGMIGKLEDWGHPQAHSDYLVWKAGRDGWVGEIMPLLDRARYVKEDGMRMNDAELKDFLNHAWESIAYDGGMGKTPGQAQGSGMRANRGSAHRQLHFKNAGTYLQYHKKFAEKSLMATLVEHIQQMSRDIALVETLGPNPDLMMRTFLDKGRQEAMESGLAKDYIDEKTAEAQRLYDDIAGKPAPLAGSLRFARGASFLRQWLNMRLGSAVLSSLADESTVFATVKAWDMSMSQYLVNELAALGSAQARREARELGLGLDTLLFSINRFASDEMASGLAHKLSGAVIRASGLSFMTEARRQAFGALMMSKIGGLVSAHDRLQDLHPGDNSLLLSKGITDAEWAVWRMAAQESVRGNKLLTARAIMAVPGVELSLRQKAADRLMGIVLDETGIAVIEPGARERQQAKIPYTHIALGTGQMGRGSAIGELGRSMLQFKSFPIAMIMRHYSRVLGKTGNVNKVQYVTALMAGMTIMGALAVQLNEIASGRDPLEMDNGRFVLRAMAKGGALGFYADYLYSQTNMQGTDSAAAIAGPTFGLAKQVLDLTQGNAVQAALGEDTDFGAELLRFMKGVTPGTSIWYTKSAIDHLFVQDLQEMASPGYLRRIEQRANREFKQRYYWRPGKALPDRAPNIDRALGSGR